ncbi:MAG: OB-fold nucleic acid binding domain-containing protein [Blastocatellia bacterium]
MRKTSMLLGVSIALLSLALTGCPERIRIGDIQNDPGRYYNKEVTVAGKVVRSYGGLGQGVYEIDDGTGTLWVATEKYGVPSKDTYVGVTGKVMPGVTWSGRNYGNGMHETRRRTRETR